MGKITLRGPVPKNHPMFSGGPKLFSPPGSNMFTTSSASGTTGATQGASTSATEEMNIFNTPYSPPGEIQETISMEEARRIALTPYKSENVTHEEELEDGKMRLARFRHQNAALKRTR